MKKQITNLLKLANFKEEEIKIYLLLLKLKKSTLSELTEKSGLHHMTVYRTAKRLIEKGMIKEVPLNNKQNWYKGLSLQSLIEKINTEQKKLFRLQKSLQNLAPLLPYINLDESAEEAIELKEGIDAFREEYLKIPNICDDEFLHVGSMERYWKAAKMSYGAPEERWFINTRIKNGISARVLDKKTKEMEEVQAHDGIEKRTTKLKNKIPIMENYLTIMANQSSLFICDEKNPRVIVIKEPELVKLHKDQFNTLWNA